MTDDTDKVLSACSALFDAAREHLLPTKARALALHLRAALLYQRELQLQLMHVVLQLKETDGRYADPDLLIKFQQLLDASGHLQQDEPP